MNKYNKWRIKFFLFDVFMSKKYIINLLTFSKIDFPNAAFFKSHEGEMPLDSFQKMFDQFVMPPIFPLKDIWNFNFKEPFFEEKIIRSEVIPLVDIVGCLASRSHKTDFKVMKVPLPKSEKEANKLENDVFRGIGDCVARKGERVDVIRQAWDGQQWISNTGGSHRSAALFQYDKKNGIKRNIECKVEIAAVSTRIKNIAQEYSMWVFSTKNWYTIFEKINRKIEAEKLEGTIGIQCLNNDNYLLVVKKGAPLHLSLSQKMPLALDVSDWVIHPEKYTYTENIFCKPK